MVSFSFVLERESYLLRRVSTRFNITSSLLKSLDDDDGVVGVSVGVGVGVRLNDGVNDGVDDGCCCVNSDDGIGIGIGIGICICWRRCGWP
jgi:hypothetical protein